MRNWLPTHTFWTAEITEIVNVNIYLLLLLKAHNLTAERQYIMLGATSLTTTWNLTKSFISLCGPLEDVNGGVRLHIVVSYVISRAF